jgi:2-keto-4-pentenoate hydratase/2-oxohepta-3-ene-1,7-dioic acid hydratase in catechol pathway
VKFARIGALGAERPVVIDGDQFFDISGITPDITGDFLASSGPERVAAGLAAGELPVIADGASQRIGAPIARPSAIICIGKNYAAHAAETNAPPPTEPIIFLKTPNTLAGPNDPVRIPRGSTKTDWEVELGVVIGARASYLDSPAESRAHIAGYVTANDLSEREWQLEVSGGQWSKGKSAPGFCPIGPWLATPDEIDDSDLRVQSWVNGEPRQDSSTKDFIFDIATLIYDLSQYLTLEPGDLILTGTPEGVALSGRFPYLKAGDVVDIEVEGLGHQRQEFVA